MCAGYSVQQYILFLLIHVFMFQGYPTKFWNLFGSNSQMLINKLAHYFFFFQDFYELDKCKFCRFSSFSFILFEKQYRFKLSFFNPMWLCLCCGYVYVMLAFYGLYANFTKITNLGFSLALNTIWVYMIGN